MDAVSFAQGFREVVDNTPTRGKGEGTHLLVLRTSRMAVCEEHGGGQVVSVSVREGRDRECQWE